MSSPLERLYERAPLGMRFGTETMAEACARAGHPERAFPTVHVAGTNGKGSVCAMVEAMAHASGLRTGLYTSPHLCRFAERIRLDGVAIDDVALDRHLEEALAYGPELSFFETATLAALLAMRAAAVELAILEVGLGGRLDATNVIPPPLAAAVTRIALDHMAILGDTVEKIAREKAAIAKPGVTLVIGRASPSVRAAIEDEARARGATPLVADEDPDAIRFFATGPHIGLAGAHQKDNACVAWVLGKQLGLEEAARAAGIAEVRWPGRLERLDTPQGPVLLDAAHNPDGAASLAAHLAPTNPQTTALLFGALADKAWTGMIDALAPRAAHRVYVEPKGRAATDPRLIAERHPGAVAGSVLEGYARAREAVGPKGLVVACGSVFLIGELRASLLGLPRDPPMAL